MTPMQIKNKKTAELTTVPCSKCPECKARRASGWSFRLMQEERVSSSAFFITLTYDTDYVPITRNGFMGLDKKHLQLFFKRLRKAHGNTGETIKYYAVGEYGGKTYRPHYHIILFNAQLELIEPAWRVKDVPIGHIHFGYVEAASVGYTLKYISKPSRIPLHRNDDRQPEFSLMSKGLGMSYLSDSMVHWHKCDLENRMYVNLQDGKKASMPRYYKDKIYNDEERLKIGQAFKDKVWEERTDEIVKDMLNEVEGAKMRRDKREGIDAAFRKQERDSKKVSNNKI